MSWFRWLLKSCVLEISAIKSSFGWRVFKINSALTLRGSQMKRYLVWTTALTGACDSIADIGLNCSRSVCFTRRSMGCTQLSTWPKMKSLIVIWASLITHLTRLKFFSAKSWSKTEVLGGWRRRRRSGALHSADEALPGHSVEVKWTAIDRPCAPQLVFTLNQPLPLIMSETGIASPNCWWATLLDYPVTWIRAPLKPVWRAKTVIITLHVHKFERGTNIHSGLVPSSAPPPREKVP